MSSGRTTSGACSPTCGMPGRISVVVALMAATLPPLAGQRRQRGPAPATPAHRPPGRDSSAIRPPSASTGRNRRRRLHRARSKVWSPRKVRACTTPTRAPVGCRPKSVGPNEQLGPARRRRSATSSVPIAVRARPGLECPRRGCSRSPGTAPRTRSAAAARALPAAATASSRPASHYRHSIAHGQRLLVVVSDVDQRRGQLGEDLDQLVEQRAPQAAIERTQRFVEHQQSRTWRQRARKRDTLLLAARELRRHALLEAASVQRARAPPRPGSAVPARAGVQARRRRCRQRRDGGRGRSPGTSAQSRGDGPARRRGRGHPIRRSPRRAARDRPRREAASTCRSRWGPGCSAARPPRPRG